MKTVLMVLFVGLLVVPLIGVQAQGVDELSEEEQALLERFFAVAETDDAYTSFSISSEETLNLTLTIDIGVPVVVSQYGTRTVDAYVIRDGDVENASGTVAVEYSSSTPDGDISYSIEADVVFLDEVLYVDAAFLESEGDVGEIESGWQVYESADDIPEVLDELDLDNLFEDEDEEELFERRELIESAVTNVLLLKDELDDGRPVEVIVLEFEGEGAAEFFHAVAEDDESGNPFVDIIYTSEGEGSVSIGIAIDENENLVGMAVELSLALEELDLTPYNIEGIPEGATLTASIENNRIDTMADINGEFDPIESPVE